MISRGKLIVAILPIALAVNPVLAGPSVASAQDEHVVAPYAQQFESHITIDSDYTATEVATERIKILTQRAIETVSEQPITFIEGVETLDTLEAYTEKADGRRIPVSAKNILTQDAAPDLPGIHYRDEKQRTIIFSDAGVGDTVVMTNKRVTTWGKTLNAYTDFQVFPRSAAYTAVKVTVEAPASIGLRVKVTGSGAVDVIDSNAGLERHTISIAPEPFEPDERGAVSAQDREPAILMSTYRSYEDLGASYGRDALPKAGVTPEIAALASEITAGIADRKAQAIAIDAWMKANIRYVGVYLSFERIIPNDASTVLKNRFGDCKDKATLMMALLAAKGIAAEQVLINSGRTYTLTEPPTDAGLNHVILYLPEFELYDDPTDDQAAFGVLSQGTYDKPVVRVSASGTRLGHTPAMKPDDHTTHTKQTLNVAADGTITGQTEDIGTGAFAAFLRSTRTYVLSVGGAVAARHYLQERSTPGTGQFDLGIFSETSDPVVIKGSFTLDERFKIPADGNVAIPDAMVFSPPPGSYLLGRRLRDRKSAFVCYAGHQTEDIEATFASPFPMPLLPAPVAIDNPVFSYQSSARIDGRTLKIHREFVSRVERQVCQPPVESTIASDLETVRLNTTDHLVFKTEGLSSAANNPISFATRATPAAAVPGPAANQVILAALSPLGTQTPAAAADVSQSRDLAKVVAIGQKLRVEFLYAIEPDCSSMGMTSVRILEPPQHGMLTVENGQGFTSFAKDNQRYDCNMRKSDGTFVFYEPEPGFAGQDSITLDIIFPTGQAFRQRYALDVR